LEGIFTKDLITSTLDAFFSEVPQYLLFAFHTASHLVCAIPRNFDSFENYLLFHKISRQSSSFRYGWRCLLSIQKWLNMVYYLC